MRDGSRRGLCDPNNLLIVPVRGCNKGMFAVHLAPARLALFRSSIAVSEGNERTAIHDLRQNFTTKDRDIHVRVSTTTASLICSKVEITYVLRNRPNLLTRQTRVGGCPACLLRRK